MDTKLIKFGTLGVALFALSACGGSKTQTADLGQVLDRADYAMSNYDVSTEGTEASDAEMEAFTLYMAGVMNSSPKFYDQQLGLELKSDASFVGFVDANGNTTRDSGEDDVFTLEVDSENERLIATDATGDAVHRRFSGSGILTGLLIGNLLSRQSRAGIGRGSFSGRNSTARSSYRPSTSSRTSSARSRSRSGGSRGGK